MAAPTVLISGAGIAGSTLAFWLARRGFTVTVVERDQGVRSSGNPVDVRAAAVDVAVAMGVLPQLADLSTRVETLSFVDERGRRKARLDIRPHDRAGGGREVEVPRSDLARVLLEAGRQQAEFVFDESITALRQDAGGVDVTLASGVERRFDLVVGSDGMHSAIRRLTFGPEHDFVRYLALFVGTLALGLPLGDSTEVVMYNAPGRSASVHPVSGNPLAAFIFRSPERKDFDHRDVALHKRMLAETYTGDGWRVPELLEQLRDTDDLYFDAVNQVRIPKCSNGRVVVLGDAASSVSLFGEGSSPAMIGAANLAEALAEHPDPTVAFSRFEAEHRPRILAKQRFGTLAARLIVPATRPGLVLRNAAARLSSRFHR